MTFDLKALRTEEGRREYYKYDQHDRVTLVHHVEPFLDPEYNKQLLDLYGTDSYGDQKIRFVWAGTLEGVQYKEMPNGETIEYVGKKYPYMRIREHYGFTFVDKQGKQITVTSEDAIPQNTPFVPAFRYDDLGIMKFAIEMKFSYEELIQLKWYPAPDDPAYNTFAFKKGRPFKLAPDPKGEYVLAHYVETEEREYRDVCSHDVDEISRIVNRALNEEEQEHIERKKQQMDEVNLKTEIDKFRKASDIIEDGIVRAEKKLVRGDVLYSFKD